MASTQGRNPLKAGLILNVEVENALDGVIMVCLRHEGRAFRGILLDSDNGSCPVGLPSKDVLTKDLNDKFGVPDDDIATIEADVVLQDPHSALSYRQSYFQNMPLPPARPLLFGKSHSSPRQKLGPTYTTRTRPLKLRPRQNFCSNCKEQCTKKKTAKRRLVSSDGEHLPQKKSRVDPLNNATAKKSVKKAKVHSLKKTLKITYATPQGKDHLTISPRSSSNANRTVPHSQNCKGTSAKPVKSEKLDQSVLPQENSNSTTKVTSEPEAKQKITVNGFHRHHKKSELKLNGRAAHSKSVRTKQRFTSSKLPGEKENSLSDTAAKEVTANGLNIHLVEEIFVPCSRARSMDSSSESSFASSVGSKKSRRRPKAASKDNIIQPELSDSEREIEFKVQPEKLDVLSKSDNNQQKRVPPLNLKVHKKNVTKYRLADGRNMCLGDIVWGKIQGSPWWPARLSQIVISRRDNGAILKKEALIRWMGASTVSHMALETLFPFLPYFKERFNKKRRGVYKNAISQAMEEAKAVSPEVRELHTMFETSEII